MSTIRRPIKLSMVVSVVLVAGQAVAAPDLTGRWQLMHAQDALQNASGASPPLTANAAVRYAANQANLASTHPDADSMLKCLPAGTPRIYLQPRAFLIIQRPTTVAFFFEHERMQRLVYVRETHGDVPDTLFMGHAVGHWDGDSLVVDSDHFKPDTFLDNTGLPHSDALHLVERLRLVGPRTLEDRMTIDDPKTFSQQWQTVLRFERQSDLHMREDLCSERLGLW